MVAIVPQCCGRRQAETHFNQEADATGEAAADHVIASLKQHQAPTPPTAPPPSAVAHDADGVNAPVGHQDHQVEHADTSNTGNQTDARASQDLHARPAAAAAERAGAVGSRGRRTNTAAATRVDLRSFRTETELKLERKKREQINYGAWRVR